MAKKKNLKEINKVIQVRNLIASISGSLMNILSNENTLTRLENHIPTSISQDKAELRKETYMDHFIPKLERANKLIQKLSDEVDPEVLHWLSKLKILVNTFSDIS